MKLYIPDEDVLVAEGGPAISVVKSHQDPNIDGITIDTICGLWKKVPQNIMRGGSGQ